MADERRLSNWLRSYVEGWAIGSEPPDLFHMWCGISAISTALGRKVSFNRGHYKLHPNTYIILIAGSAKCRKSTAVRMAGRMLKELEDAQRVTITRNKITPERLIEALGKMIQAELPSTSAEFIARGSEALIYAPELTTLIDARSHTNGLITLLTDLYDCPDRWNNETKHKGYDHLYNVFLNILGATIPSELAEVMPLQSIGSGFTSRIIFVFQRTNRKRIAHPEEFYGLAKIRQLEEDLLHDIRLIHKITGEYKWSNDAKDMFTKWYEAFGEPDDEKMEGYHGRKHDHAIKLAIILSASLSSNMIIEVDHLLAAIRLLEEVEVYMTGVYQLLAGSVASGDHIRWILKHLIRNNGSMAHSDILRKGWSRFKDARHFADVIQLMIDSEMITRETQAHYHKQIYHIANEEIVRSMLEK